VEPFSGQEIRFRSFLLDLRHLPFLVFGKLLGRERRMQDYITHQFQKATRAFGKAGSADRGDVGAEFSRGHEACPDTVNLGSQLGAGPVSGALAEHFGCGFGQSRQVLGVSQSAGFHPQCERHGWQFVLFQHQDGQTVGELRFTWARQLHTQDFLAHRSAVEPLHL
jgi:hypothetical protein